MKSPSPSLNVAWSFQDGSNGEDLSGDGLFGLQANEWRARVAPPPVEGGEGEGEGTLHLTWSEQLSSYEAQAYPLIDQPLVAQSPATQTMTNLSTTGSIPYDITPSGGLERNTAIHDHYVTKLKETVMASGKALRFALLSGCYLGPEWLAQQDLGPEVQLAWMLWQHESAEVLPSNPSRQRLVVTVATLIMEAVQTFHENLRKAAANGTHAVDGGLNSGARLDKIIFCIDMYASTRAELLGPNPKVHIDMLVADPAGYEERARDLFLDAFAHGCPPTAHTLSKMTELCFGGQVPGGHASSPSTSHADQGRGPLAKLKRKRAAQREEGLQDVPGAAQLMLTRSKKQRKAENAAESNLHPHDTPFEAIDQDRAELSSHIYLAGTLGDIEGGAREDAPYKGKQSWETLGGESQFRY